MSLAILKGYTVNEDGNPLSEVNIDIKSNNQSTKLTSNNNGEWSATFPITDFNPKNVTIVFTKDDYELKDIKGLTKTGVENENDLYDINRITLLLTPDIENEANNAILQEMNEQEGQDISSKSREKLDPSAKILASINEKKTDLKNILLPTVIKLLVPFGPLAVQAVLKKLPTNQILNLCKCPKKSVVLDLIKKRNNLARSINNVYNIIKSISTVLTTIETIITAVQAGVLVLEVLPAPAQFATIGVIETLGSIKDGLKDLLKLAKVGINLLTITLGTFGIILGIILRLLNSLDTLVAKCVEDQNIPFETINNELNLFVNDSTGISNSRVIAELNNTSPPRSELFTPEVPGFDTVKVFLDEQKIINNQLFVETQNTAEDQNTSQLISNPENVSPETNNAAAASVAANALPSFPPPGTTISTPGTTASDRSNFAQPSALNQVLTTLINNDPTVAGAFGNSILNSLGVANPTQDGVYKGFTLEIKLDESNNSKYPRRFAQALNAQGIPVLKTESSFASDPQVLLNELKFIIDSNPNLSAV